MRIWASFLTDDPQRGYEKMLILVKYQVVAHPRWGIPGE